MVDLYNTAVDGQIVEFVDDSCPGIDTCTTSSSPACILSSGSVSDINSAPVVSEFSGVATFASPGCCTASSCVFSYIETESVSAERGDSVRFQYKAEGGNDWFEAAIVLYSGTVNPGSVSATETTPIAAVKTIQTQQ